MPLRLSFGVSSRLLLQIGALAILVGAANAQIRLPERGVGTKSTPKPKVESRIALVIGNSAYPDTPLRNPVNDANDIATTLESLGFTVLKTINANQKAMDDLIAEFGRRLGGSSIALFFFAGHGVQVQGENYLIPISATINKHEDVKYKAVNAGVVLSQMEGDPNRANIIILDACRNNPFRSFRDLNSGGLAQMKAPAGSLIAYATAPGEIASDGNERNGLYTGELLKQLRVPGQSLVDVLMATTNAVRQKSGGQQVPWQSSSLGKHIYLNGSPTGGAMTNLTEEQALWNVVQFSNSAQEVREFLQQFPSSRFASAAQALLRRLAANATSNAENIADGDASQSSFRAIQETKPVTVLAKVGWVSTGLTLEAGQQVEIQAAGNIRVEGSRQTGAAGVQRFEPKSPLPNCQFGALLARIGSAAPVCIRDKGTLDATQKGELQLGVNDHNLQDNDGVLNATITVRGVLQRN